MITSSHRRRLSSPHLHASARTDNAPDGAMASAEFDDETAKGGSCFDALT
jgi:hypothetical protein